LKLELGSKREKRKGGGEGNQAFSGNKLGTTQNDRGKKGNSMRGRRRQFKGDQKTKRGQRLYDRLPVSLNGKRKKSERKRDGGKIGTKRTKEKVVGISNKSTERIMKGGEEESEGHTPKKA